MKMMNFLDIIWKPFYAVILIGGYCIFAFLILIFLLFPVHTYTEKKNGTLKRTDK